ncbi:MAG: class I SAM-dependent methyltransferase [Candidatus Levyibacteriota bacterium]
MTERVERTATVYNEIASKYAKNKADKYSDRAIWTFTDLLSPGSRIISIGCGHGRDEALFKQRGFAPVGVDVSKYLLQIASQQNPDIPFVILL